MTRAEATTLVPGDRVVFDGREWTVFLTPRNQRPDSPIAIHRTDRPQFEDLIRRRDELRLVPRAPA